ncbi:MAG: putative trypsin-like protease [Acidimicrobiales bacterium]|nr:putative trypsin-like protease [Acidimicrobiales bacterium]
MLVPTLALVLLATVVASGPAQASPPGGSRSPRIVGGTTAGSGAYPFMAGILFTINTTNGPSTFQCGGTVIAVSWVMTAAHCATDDSGNTIAPSAYSVRIGSNQFNSGGALYSVSSVIRRGDFDGLYLDNDVALLRLSKPTGVAPVQVITPAEGALYNAGTSATTAGWGLTSYNGTPSDNLLQVQLPMVSDATCKADYPVGRKDEFGYPLEFHADKHVCAGFTDGGKDSCSGDSGGPLLVPGADTAWRQVGVVSWGYQCAVANNPGVYTKLSTYSAWVGSIRRFGPFESSPGYIARMFVDFASRFPTAQETSSWTSQLNSQPPSSLPVFLEGSQTWQSTAWAVTRLYLASLGRDPDNGLASWINLRFQGDSLARIAEKFAAEPEFRNKYDALSNPDFVDAIYNNVFGRKPDAGGKSYWTGRLNSGMKRSDLMIGFTESQEYLTKTHDRVRVITTYEALLRRVPTTPELSAGQALSLTALVNKLRTSFSYANRF